MREAIGGTWLFNLVIFFVLLFAGYMCLSINYSKAFSVKDKIITEIERNGGIKQIDNVEGKDPTIEAIAKYLQDVGYRTKGKCKTSNINDDQYEYGCQYDGKCYKAISSQNYAYCLKEIKADESYKGALPGEFLFVSYYKVKVFYHLDLPVIRSAFDFNIKGDTKLLYNVKNESK